MKPIDESVNEIEKITDSFAKERKELLSKGRQFLYSDPDNREKNEALNNLIKTSIQEDRLLTIDEAADLLGVTTQTLRNWDKKGKLKPIKTETGHRRYTEHDINDLRRKQMGSVEMIVQTTPINIEKMIGSLINGFDPLENVNISIRHDVVSGNIKIIVESNDGLHGVTRSFQLD